jgi:hypothetical protein
MLLFGLAAISAFIGMEAFVVYSFDTVKALVLPVTMLGIVSYFIASSALCGKVIKHPLAHARWLPLIVAVPCALWTFDATIHHQLLTAWLAIITGGVTAVLNYFAVLAAALVELESRRNRP